MSRSQPIRKPQIKRDGSTAPRTQLKQCTPQQRAWAWELGQTMSGEQARRAIKDELGIWLGSDSAYSAFRQWQFRQAQWDYLDEMATQDELNMKDVCPGISREMLRDRILKRMHARADMMGDLKLQVAVVKADQDEEAGRREDKKLQLLIKKAEAYDRAQAALADAKQDRGGITPETLTKIERELKLL